MATIRDAKTKQAFIKHLRDHPEERFWQAIRNFSGYDFILRAEQTKNYQKAMETGEFWENPKDTFYIEADKEKK